MTYADYLAFEHTSECKHEFVDGEIILMSGASLEHSQLELRIGVLLVMRIRQGCTVYPANQRIKIEAKDNGRYADSMIICGSPRVSPTDDQAITNPLVLVEVLSPTTERFDRGAKFEDYQTLPTLEAYMLVAQDRRQVEVHRRVGTSWIREPHHHRDSDLIELPGLIAPISVDDIYRGILDAVGRSLIR
jgi:Uma2 family endonuclease